MDTKRLFDLLVEHHCKNNLPDCLPAIRDGQVRCFPSWEPFIEGEGEVPYYPGLLVISNGPTLVDKLIDNGLAKRDNIEKFSSMSDDEEFFDYINGPGRKDGVHLYDGQNQRITRVHEINNTSLQDSSTDTLLDRLPPDFVYADGSNFSGGDIGTKTRLAIKLPMNYPSLEALQVKQTAYGRPGLGKITHFDQYGLLREFFFDYDAETETIVGVRREYLRGDLVAEDGMNYVEERIPIHQEHQKPPRHEVRYETVTEPAA